MVCADLATWGPLLVLYLTSFGKATCRVANALSSLIIACPGDDPARSSVNCQQMTEHLMTGHQSTACND